MDSKSGGGFVSAEELRMQINTTQTNKKATGAVYQMITLTSVTPRAESNEKEKVAHPPNFRITSFP
jgi:hypothetical protein